ncbi:MAG: hypothetical protein U0Q18_34870 [Bryobacteraceae bacterium]
MREDKPATPENSITEPSGLLRRVASYTCLGAGVLGLMLPVIPGIPLLILGCSLLGRDDPVAKRVMALKQRLRKAQ